MAELEAHGGQGPSDLLKDELSQSLEELEALLKAKDEVGTYCAEFKMQVLMNNSSAHNLSASLNLF